MCAELHSETQDWKPGSLALDCVKNTYEAYSMLSKW
jgi:hypothetical protein